MQAEEDAKMDVDIDMEIPGPLRNNERSISGSLRQAHTLDPFDFIRRLRQSQPGFEDQLFHMMPNRSFNIILGTMEREMEDDDPFPASGATNEEINALPTHEHDGKGEKAKSCAICLSNFERGENVRTLPCFHSFHRLCIDKWLLKNRICPVCRVSVDQNV